MTFLEAIDALGQVSTQEAIEVMKGKDKFQLRWKIRMMSNTLTQCAETAALEEIANLGGVEVLG